MEGTGRERALSLPMPSTFDGDESGGLKGRSRTADSRATPSHGKVQDGIRPSPTNTNLQLSPVEHTPTPHNYEWAPAPRWPPMVSQDQVLPALNPGQVGCPSVAGHFGLLSASAPCWQSTDQMEFPYPPFHGAGFYEDAVGGVFGDYAVFEPFMRPAQGSLEETDNISGAWVCGDAHFNSTPAIATIEESREESPAIPVPTLAAFANDAADQSSPGATGQDDGVSIVALASIGSKLHDGTGRCSPCAWFHKERSCAAGTACNYCHLCPEGELKMRKKAKVMALRQAGVKPKQR